MYNECRHLFLSGKKCGSPALKHQNFCYYHSNTRKREKRAADNQPYDRINPKNTALALPTLDEGDAIQLAISEVVLALANNTIDPRRARIMLYGLQIASQHYRHKIKSGARVPGAPFKPAVGLSGNENIVREIHHDEDGLELGPEKQSPDKEDMAEDDGPMTLGKFLLLEAIKEGLIDPKEIFPKEQEWKELRKTYRSPSPEPRHQKIPDEDTIDLQATAEQPSGCPILSRILRKGGRQGACRRFKRFPSHRNSRTLTTLQKHGGA
jgi:hypothetical protein